MTERLYYADSKRLKFSARVVALRPQGERCGVVLSQTAFYPTGGGQPHDTGRLGGTPVLDVSETEGGGEIEHWLAASPAFGPGDEVVGEVDAPRRLEFMQQHTGQHILSQAFLRAGNIETRSVHMGEEISTIDLAMESPDEALIRRAEAWANQIVFEDREVTRHEVSETELSRFPIRKEPAVSGCVRLIEIRDFDWSPCGGTHAHRTGEVGLIVVRGWERAKRMTRIEFACGVRALRDYRLANETARTVARLLTTGRDASPEKVAQLLEENKQQLRRLRELAAIAADVEAERLYRDAECLSGARIIARVFTDRGPEEARLLARKLTDRGGVIVLFGLDHGGAGRLLFTRSAGMGYDMNEWLRAVCRSFDGRGGGSPDMAQGGIKEHTALERALRAAVEHIKPPA